VKPGRTFKPQGQIRQSQVVMTFGPGSMMDLPEHSVLIAGLEYWTGVGNPIVEPRLEQKLKALLKVPTLQLRPPPPENQDPTAAPTHIVAWKFPQWFITRNFAEGDPNRSNRSRRLVHLKALTRGSFIDDNHKKQPVVPVRFVRACRCGHIEDIDWFAFVHGGASSCRDEFRPLWIDERGTTGDLSEIWIRCGCGIQRPMNDAARLGQKPLGHCDGSRPWLGPYTKEACGEPNRLLIRTASNAYFGQSMSVISLPERDEQLEEVVTSVWEDFLETVETLEDLQTERRKREKVKKALHGFTDDEVFAEIIAHRSGTTIASKPVKQAELETLIAAQDGLGSDRPDGNFYARALSRSAWDHPWMEPIERIVLVHRLREVVAQVGFTRFEAAAPDVSGELEMGVRSAALARDITWLPAVENRGEGVFLQFKKASIEQWAARPDVQARIRTLVGGFDLWKEEHQSSGRKFPGAAYILLHSFSHMLLTAISLECGYPASSIRERIYALPELGYGVLLYTGSSDAEGTLGGLIEVGRRIHEHVRSALHWAELCSNDPVCSQHNPQNRHESRFLLGAACHGCLLVAETSCEQRNDFLDRSLVVSTVESLHVEFFPREPS
jgi:hypothetical protein